MVKKLACMLLSMGLIWASVGEAQMLSEEQRLSDFQQLISGIQAGYGPLQYKQAEKGITVAALAAKYNDKVKLAKSNGEFYYSLLQFIAEFQDGHFGGFVPTKHASSLAVTTELIEGHVLIGEVDRTKLTQEQFPFSRGDEVVAINGKPVMEVVNELKSYIGTGYDLTRTRMATWMLFNRSGQRVPVPTGEVSVTVRLGTSDITQTAKLKWVEKEEAVDEQMELSSFDTIRESINYDQLSQRDELISFFGRDFIDRSFLCSGDTRIAIPDGATKIIEKPFLAYYHATPKGNVGYLRIPHYMPLDERGQPLFEQTFAQYQYAVRVLEQNTVGLIIDQDHNCGGSVDYLEKIVGLFMDHPYKPMQFQLRANKAEWLMFKSWADQTTPNTIEQQDILKVLALIRDSWSKGLYLTPPTSIVGREIYPVAEVHYTKPIVMLIDEISGSGGDAFPSLMQGYGRATLLGTRTSGLGGHVQPMPPLNNSGLNWRMTKSLFFRPDGTAVENNGAKPDIPYTLTRDDFMYGYRNYQKAYLKALLDRVQ